MMVRFTVWRRHPVVQDALPLPMEFVGLERVTNMIGPWQNVRATLVNAHDSASVPATNMFLDPRAQKTFSFGWMYGIHSSTVSFVTFPYYGTISIFFTRMFGFILGSFMAVFVSKECSFFFSTSLSAMTCIYCVYKLSFSLENIMLRNVKQPLLQHVPPTIETAK